MTSKYPTHLEVRLELAMDLGEHRQQTARVRLVGVGRWRRQDQISQDLFQTVLYLVVSCVSGAH